MKINVDNSLTVEKLESFDHIVLETDKLTDDQRQQLLEALQKPKGGRLWLPKDGNTYWYADDNYDGRKVIYWSIWRDDNYDKLHFAQGNVFKTKAEAEKHAQRLKDLYEVKKWVAENCPQWTPNWNDDTQTKFHIFYADNELRVAGWTISNYGLILSYLETEQQCRDLIAAKEPELLRIFGVES